MSVRRQLAVVLVLFAGLLCASTGVASAQEDQGGSGYFVTFVARSCPDYTDIFANKARNDILESLKDLGPDSQYLDNDRLINPDDESLPPQDKCTPLANWQFTLGTGIESKAVTGPWGALSKVTGVFPRSPITTQVSTPLLDQNGTQIGNRRVAGATTIELTQDERRQASNSGQLWAQGGTPTDPVLADVFPGPKYGFGALRCATDDVNGDNVEYIYFPTGVTHVFCYGLYVTPPPTAGVITIEKHVSGGPEGDNPSFPFNGSISYDPNGFQLTNGGSMDFVRAGGATWQVTEGSVDNYGLSSVRCTAVDIQSGEPGTSTTTVSGRTTSISLVAGEHVTCVYDNQYVPPRGGLTIRKITRGGAGSFRYLVSPASGSGRRHRATATTTEPGVPVDAEPSLLSLAPGTYRVRERPVATAGGHWRLVRVRCNGETRPTAQPTEVEIHSGQATVCTFVNRFIPSGSIALSKITTGATGTAAFLISPNRDLATQYLQHATTTSEGVAADAHPATPADATDHVRLGEYTIVEQSPPSPESENWELQTVLCDGVTVPFEQGAIMVRLTREHPSVHCTFGDLFTPTPPPVPPTPPTPPPKPPVPPAPPSPPITDAVADLLVTKQASVSVVTLGQSVTYRIKVRNLGPDPAQRVVVNDQPHGRATIVSARSSVGGCRTSPRVICRLGTLKAGASALITVRLVPTFAGSHFTNRAVVGSATNETTLANNVAHATIRVLAPPPPPPGRG